MFDYRLPLATDLDRAAGVRAYEAMSFHPEERATSDIANYVREVTAFAELLAPRAASDAQKAKAAEEVERFRVRYIDYQRVIWAARSRTMSPMITGPARFPVARNNKALDVEEKRVREFLDWLPKARRSALKALEMIDAPTAEIDTREPITETVNGVEVVQNFALDRVQILFDGKPDSETIARLKGAGWNWSPRNGAWQRKLTGNALYSARFCITGSRFAAPTDATPTPENTYETMGRVFDVTATFDNDSDANAYLAEHEDEAVIGCRGSKVLIAAKADQGRKIETV